MTLRSLRGFLLSAMCLLGVALVPAPIAKADPPERFEAARLGVAPAVYDWMEFEGSASISDDGLGWAQFNYSLRDRNARPKRAVWLAVRAVAESDGIEVTLFDGLRCSALGALPPGPRSFRGMAPAPDAGRKAPRAA